jgi:hypothetical protein
MGAERERERKRAGGRERRKEGMRATPSRTATCKGQKYGDMIGWAGNQSRAL